MTKSKRKAKKEHLTPREARAKRDLDEVMEVARDLAHPRPWKVLKPGEGIVAMLADAFFILDANDSIVARLSFSYGGLEMQLASAELLVRCVNAAAPEPH